MVPFGGAKPLLPLALLIASLSGCLGPAPRASELTSTPEGLFNPPARTLIHGFDGVRLAPDSFPGQLPEFEQRYVLDFKTSEPTLGITSSGAAFFPASKAQKEGGPGAVLLRTNDRGQTWTVANRLLDAAPLPPASIDPYVHADPSTDRVFFVMLYLGCLWVSWTDDEGKTWDHNPVACGGLPPHDHETLFTGPATVAQTLGYPNVVYLCSNNFIAAATCARSLDGGRTFEPSLPTYVETEGDNRALPTACSMVAHGHGVASYAADGTAYLPRGYCGKALVEISRDNGASWETVLVDDSQGFIPDDIDNHEGTLAVDAAGNAYYFWIAADAKPRLSISRDEGQSWSKPMRVGAPGVTGARFPSIVAGDEGRAAFSYYGTTVAGGLNAAEKKLAEASWNAYVGVSLNLLDLEPVFAATIVNPVDDPVKRGACNGRCGTQGLPGTQQSVGDYLDLQIEPATGQVWMAIADLCNDACAKPDGTSTDPVTNRAAVGIQVGGTPLREQK